MLPKKERLTRALFAEVGRFGRSIKTEHFLVKTLSKSSQEGFRAGVSVSKKVAKKASARNSLRRMAYREISRLRAGMPRGSASIFIFLSPCEREVAAEEIAFAISRMGR